MLRVKGLTIAYPNRPPILRGISFELAAGSVTALMGSSGLGKTSLLKVLAGIHPASSGLIELAPEATTIMMFQEDRLLPWITARQNVLLGMRVPDEKRVTEMLNRMGIEDPSVLPDALSGGMQRRVALARAMLAGGDLLLLDEPFTGIDDPLKSTLAEIILANRKTVLFSTHDEREAFLMNASVLALHQDRAEWLPLR